MIELHILLLNWIQIASFDKNQFYAFTIHHFKLYIYGLDPTNNMDFICV